MTVKEYCPIAEWVGMQEKYNIDKLDKMDQLEIERLLDFEVFRDNNYKIKGEIVGENFDINKIKTDYHKEHEGGEIAEGIKLIGSNYYGDIMYIMEDCLFNNHSLQYTNLNEIPIEKVSMSFSTNKVQKIYYGNKDKATDILIEWYLNGPNISFARSTEREFTSIIKRKRYNVDDRFKIVNTRKYRSGSRDCALIEYNDKKVIVFKVLKDIKPQWSNNIGIEYRKEWGIPDETERVAITEILSFIFGGQLLKVGHTEYDVNYNPIKEISINPWGENVVSKCRASKNSPIGLYYDDIAFEMEDILKRLIPKYLELREDLKLSNVLWRYWIAMEMPIGTNLPVLSSGLEMLSNSWFKSPYSESKGIHIEKDAYLNLIEDEIISLTNKLDCYEFKDKVINKLKFAYNMGINEKIERFFEEINLQVSKIEKKALRARNDMAHGSTLKSKNDIVKAIRLSRAYETLFERTFLRILDYDGIYIDKSIKGWPVRYMNEELEKH